MGDGKDVTGGFNAEKAFEQQTFDGRTLDNKVHLFMGQFSGDWETPEEMAEAVKEMGYDGIGAVTWGSSGIDVVKAVGPEGVKYLAAYIKAMDQHGIGISTVGDHLATQAISAAIIDNGLVSILPPDVTRGYDPNLIVHTPALHEEIRFNAALHTMNTARVTERIREVALDVLGPEKQQERYNPTVVSGFTGSPIWHLLAGFPPVDEETIERGYQEVAFREARVLDVYRDTGNKRALETHPGEIAYDLVTALRTDDTINRAEFGFNGDSSHSVGRRWDYLKYLEVIAGRGKLHASHLKGASEGLGDGSGGAYRSHLAWGDEAAYWDFKSIGRGTQNDGAVIYKLGDVGFKGPFEIEWEDAQLKKVAGAVASAKIVRGFVTGNQGLVMEGLKMYENATNYERAKFDAAFETK
ncbi:MAG: TIM barrel protein [archaeon]